MSAGEILLIFFVALMLFGSKSLPGFAGALGRAYREFKRATDDIKQEIPQNPEIATLKKEVGDLQNDLSGNVNRVKESIQNGIDNTQNSIGNEASKIENVISNNSENAQENIIKDTSTDNYVNLSESEYNYDVYKDAALKVKELDEKETLESKKILTPNSITDISTENK